MTNPKNTKQCMACGGLVTRKRLGDLMVVRYAADADVLETWTEAAARHLAECITLSAVSK